MKYRIKHTTSYDYSEPASTSHNLLHVTPRDLPDQRCLHSTLTIDPPPLSTSSFVDTFGNTVTCFDLHEPHTRLSVTASSIVTITPPPPGQLLPPSWQWEVVRDAVRTDRTPEGLDAYAMTYPSRHIRLANAFGDYARLSFTPGRAILEAALDLTGRIFHDFRFDPLATTLSTPIEQVMEQRHGVCQDFAHVMLACLRSLRLPARYVSGYLRTDPPPGQPRMIGADASHAWVSVWSPGVGWFDFDPTNNCTRNDRHIILGWGRDYADVSPVKGVVLGGGPHALSVSVDAAPMPETSSNS